MTTLQGVNEVKWTRRKKKSTLQGMSQTKKIYRGKTKIRSYYKGINLFILK
jgi:hypothetical protein